ncbi:ATP-binding cassette domain-containing protein [Sphingomonas arantia]|uniref:ATP-binding cassette domain-containing protein n=1 Tax=Sphingomonas arantia TaxID=1460676 RepID=A0ABW4TSN4_9SPHN
MDVTTTAIAFEGVTKRYGDAIVVDAVTLDIVAGSFVALVGTSGSGKSTLLKMVNRLVEPDAGAVRVAGVAVAGGDAPVLRRSIGYVFQNVGLFPHLSVADNIAIRARLGEGVPDVGALLTQVGLEPDVAKRSPRALSGGQQQRVGIARALAGDAKILLMDEPFGALDPVTRERIGQTVRELHVARGLTTIMVTHDMGEALLLADRVLVMVAGRIVADATPAEMLRAEDGPAAALVAVPRGQAARMQALADGGTA